VFRFRVALALLVALAPIGAQGQLSVHVADSSGRALMGARVELWSSSAQSAARSTNADGIAAFSAVEARAATVGLVRRIGFAPAHFAFEPTDSAVIVRMSALVLSVPALTITAVARACPQSDEPDARAVWAAAAARFREPSVIGRYSMMEQQTSLVAEADVGIIDGSRVATGWRGYTSLGMEGGVARLERRGYVYALRENHTHEMFGAWQYPPLEAELAGHFASEVFGARHDFRVVSRSASTVMIRYCARDRNASGLDGTMRISGSDGLLDARWRYWNPSRERELAGGEVTFAPAPRDGSIAPLVSTSGLFWRRTPSGRYSQRWQRYIEWTFETEDDVVERPTERCRPPENYVVCSAIRVRRSGGSVLDCSMMPYHCADEEGA
jgi:hypothetical protein